MLLALPWECLFLTFIFVICCPVTSERVIFKTCRRKKKKAFGSTSQLLQQLLTITKSESFQRVLMYYTVLILRSKRQMLKSNALVDACNLGWENQLIV